MLVPAFTSILATSVPMHLDAVLILNCAVNGEIMNFPIRFSWFSGDFTYIFQCNDILRCTTTRTCNVMIFDTVSECVSLLFFVRMAVVGRAFEGVTQVSQSVKTRTLTRKENPGIYHFGRCIYQFEKRPPCKVVFANFLGWR